MPFFDLKTTFKIAGRKAVILNTPSYGPIAFYISTGRGSTRASAGKWCVFGGLAVDGDASSDVRKNWMVKLPDSHPEYGQNSKSYVHMGEFYKLQAILDNYEQNGQIPEPQVDVGRDPSAANTYLIKFKALQTDWALYWARTRRVRLKYPHEKEQSDTTITEIQIKQIVRKVLQTRGII